MSQPIFNEMAGSRRREAAQSGGYDTLMFHDPCLTISMTLKTGERHSHGMSDDRRLRRVGFLWLVFALGLPAGCSRSGDDRNARPKHVLLLTVDTLRQDYLSCNGYDLPTTPFLDKMIGESFYFERAVTPIPRTTQALASILTGCYPQTTGVRKLWDNLRPEVVTVAQLAQNAGYDTIAVVSNHVLMRKRGLYKGFQIYDQAKDTRDAAITTMRVKKHLKKLKAKDNIFLWVHYIDPHVPYFPPNRYAKEFDPEYKNRYPLHFGQAQGGTGNAAYPRNLPKRIAVYRNPLSDSVNAHIRRLYAADIRSTDDAIAKLVSWLRQRFGKDWVILFTADHGESLGEHDFFFDHGDYVYDATLRVPLFISLPPDNPHYRKGRCSDLVSLIDVMPTLVDLLQLSIPNDLPYEIEGRSLVDYLFDAKLPARAVFAECGYSFFPKMVRRRVQFDVAGRFRSVTSGSWKLIWTPGGKDGSQYELYNLADDPKETNNLFATSRPIARKLEESLEKWLQTGTDTATKPSKEELKRLRSLGYVD